MCYTISFCRLSILNIQCVHDLPKVLNYPFPLTIPSPSQLSLSWVHFPSLWVSFCFVSKFIYIISFYIPHIKDVIWYFPFSVWHTSLSMTLSRSIYVAANGFISFFNGWIILYIYTHTHTHTHDIFLHSSVNGHLDFFHVLVIVNSVAMNIAVHVSFGAMF